jgi:hypothetical protein
VALRTEVTASGSMSCAGESDGQQNILLG